MRRVLLLVLWLRSPLWPFPALRRAIPLRFALSSEVRQYEPKAAPEPRTVAPAPSVSFTLAADAWDCIPAGLGIVRPDYGPALAYCAAPLSPAVRKRPQVWEYG